MNKTQPALLLKEELIGRLKVSKAQINAYMRDGMPHFMIGNEYRFLENEVKQWLETYEPTQDRLEREFRDKNGRTLEEYVNAETVLKILRINKQNLTNLSKKGLPFEKVGEKNFYNIPDILDYYRRGDGGVSERSEQDDRLLDDVPTGVPLIIIDGSYNFKRYQVGTGMVLIENQSEAKGFSNVRSIKTAKPIICEFIALLDALRMIKKKNITKAIIVTDQKAWTSGISIEAASYEASLKKHINDLKALWTELKGHVEIRYVEEMTAGKNNLIYKKAHDLSRIYMKTTMAWSTSR